MHKIKKKKSALFIKINGFKLNKINMDLEVIAREIGLKSLTSKQLFNDVSFIYKV